MRVEWLSTGAADAAGAARRLPPAVRWTFGLAVAAYVAVAAWLVWRTAILQPYSDMFDWLERYFAFRSDGDFARYLWAPHNFHHLAATFSVLALDIQVFGGSGYLFLTTGAACWAATAAMMGALGARAAGPGLRLIGAGGAVALALMGCDVLDATADINTTYVYALAPAMGAVLLAEGRWRGARAAALVLAAVAGLGSAAGLAVWPALLAGAWRRGERGWTVTVLIAAAAAALIYLVGERAPGPSAAAAGWARVRDGAGLVINYLGLPWSRGALGWGPWIGAVVLAAALAALRSALRDGERLARIAAALIVFSLATAAMAGVARSGILAPGLVPIRYAVFLVPLHVGVWLVVLPHLRRLWLLQPQRMEAVAMAAAALMVTHQAVTAIYAVRTADENRATIDAFHAGKRTPDMLVTIYPDLGKAQAISERLRRQGLYQRELRGR